MSLWAPLLALLNQALAYIEVKGWEHIMVCKGEDHEHVDAPGADAFDIGEHGGNGVVVHVDNGSRGDDPRGIVAGKVMEVGCLARGYPIWRS